jgi:hypothetical protein
MARTPRAKVAKTAGQGVSRLAYQKGYALKRGQAPKIKAAKRAAQAAPDKRSYGKQGKPAGSGDIDIAYDVNLPLDELFETPGRK